jgi:Na+/glutamate symporter
VTPGRLTVLLACAACGAAIGYNSVSQMYPAGTALPMAIAARAMGVLLGVFIGGGVGKILIAVHALAAGLSSSKRV